MTYTPPPRNPGSVSGWVEPAAVQDGTHLRRVSTGAEVILRGVCSGSGQTLGNGHSDYLTNPNFYGFWSAMPGLSMISYHFQWSDLETTMPTSPTSGRNFSGGYILADMLGVAEYLDAAGTFFNIHLIVPNVSSYFPGGAGIPAFMYDSALWPQGQTAPLPANRAAYGGDYPATTQGQTDATTAMFARGTTTVKSKGSGITWSGDSAVINAWLEPLLLYIYQEFCQFPHFLGLLVFNEPSPGDLAKSINLGSNVIAVQEMLLAQKPAFDYLLGLDPQRGVGVMGLSSSAWEISPDFTVLVDGVGGLGKFPTRYPIWLHTHSYSSYQGTPQSPGDVYATTDAQKNISANNPNAWSSPTTYQPTTPAGLPSQYNVYCGYGMEQIDWWAAKAASMNALHYVSEYGCYNQISGTPVTGCGQYVTDTNSLILARHSTHSTYFQAGPSTGLGLTTITGSDGQGRNVYAVNSTTGAALEAALAVPFLPRHHRRAVER